MKYIFFLLSLLLFLSPLTGCEDAPPEQSSHNPSHNPSNERSIELANLNHKEISSLTSKNKDSQTLNSNALETKPFESAKAFEKALQPELRKLISDIPSTSEKSDEIKKQDSKQSPENSITTPEDVAKVIENARDEKAVTEAINSAFKEAHTQDQQDSPPIFEGASPFNPLFNEDDLSKITALSSNSASSSPKARQKFNPGVRVPNQQQPSTTAPLSGGFDFTGKGNVGSPSDESLNLNPVSGQARGYSMFYLMHPRARQTVEKQITALIRSNVQEVFLGVLTDGTFGKDFGYLNSILSRIASAGRRIYLTLYLTNGPTMRVYDITPIKVGFNNIEPGAFRNLIRFNPETQSKFKTMAQEVLQVLNHNRQLGALNKNYVSVMLEDNLDGNSYQAMRELAKTIIGDRAQFIRSPCPGCYQGNTAESLGNQVELHAQQNISNLTNGDGFSFDGFQFLYPQEDGVGITYESATGLATQAKDQGLSYFGLWRANWQGLQNGPLVHPDNRPYHIPTDEELEFDISLLRYGLN